MTDAEKPEEWDDEEDGEWIAPTVRNPKCDEAPGCGEWKRPYKANPAYKGKWYAPMIDNPAYKGEWAPRKIPNPAFFEDLTPVKSLIPIGGVGIELWTMTEDILFDNLYVGNSVEDARKLAEETYFVKKPLEEALEKAATKADEEDEDESTVSFKEDPAEFVRSKVFKFIEAAKVDPLTAFKTHPETGASLVLSVVTLFGMLGVLFGFVGAQQKPITKVCYPLHVCKEATMLTSHFLQSTKKTDAPSPDDKKKSETAPVAPAGGAKDETPVKKRK